MILMYSLFFGSSVRRPPRPTRTDTPLPPTSLCRTSDEDQEERGRVFQHWSLAEVSVGSPRADGRIDIVHREYKLTAEAAAREFGEDKLPDGIRRKLRDKPDEEFKFLHAIYPRTPYAVGAKLAKNLPFASCHVAMESKTDRKSTRLNSSH